MWSRLSLALRLSIGGTYFGAAVVPIRNHLEIQCLSRSRLRRVIGSQGQTPEHWIKINLRRGQSSSNSARFDVQAIGILCHLLSHGRQTFRLLRRRAVDEVLAKQGLHARIHFCEAIEKTGLLCFPVPLGQNQIDELGCANISRSRSVSPRKNQFRHRPHGRKLTRTQGARYKGGFEALCPDHGASLS